MGEKGNGLKFGKLMIQLVIIAICWELVYIIPFIQYTLYDPILKALQCSNTQLGFLLTIYGLGNIFGAPIGGWLADRFDYRKIILGSVFLNGIVSFLFAFNMNYTFAVITWVGCAITSLVMNYPSMVKILRVIGKENQGKVYGFNEAMVGVSGVVMGAIFLYIYTLFSTPVLGMRWVMISLGILSIVMCPVLWFVIKDVDISEEKEEGKNEKMAASDFMVVLKSPNTWLVGISIFCVYSFTVTMSYFTPYITSVLGGSVALSGALAIIRQHGLKLFGAPFGGYCADKVKSPTKVLLPIYVLGIAVIILFLVLPSSTPMTLFIALTFVVGILGYMGKGIYYAVQEEVNVPVKYSATTIGIAAALGFSPDVFQFALIGHWIDTYGNKGYTYTFIFQIAILIIGILSCLYILKVKKRRLDKLKV
ncbi:MFS transporter [Clostridioides sp. ZZV15-6388]|uniref:MFS transporter n=1 Tax=unclassified Clostridioides TaxID=2635829 RepID=UPI001D0FD858|nr:MFS transporter [Clostridioides sp. ZZV15-6388]MCC0665021.1 MFS transporter [Clostridioides sp. ZZV15-6597]